MNFTLYAIPAMAENFTDRFRRLTDGVSDTDVGAAMGVTADAVRKIRAGDILSIKFEHAMRLCRKLGFSPYDLAGLPKPPESASEMAESDRSRLQKVELEVDQVLETLGRIEAALKLEPEKKGPRRGARAS